MTSGVSNDTIGHAVIAGLFAVGVIGNDGPLQAACAGFLVFFTLMAIASAMIDAKRDGNG